MLQSASESSNSSTSWEFPSLPKCRPLPDRSKGRQSVAIKSFPHTHLVTRSLVHSYRLVKTLVRKLSYDR